MGGSRGGRDGAVAGPHRRNGATGRRGGGRGAGRAGTKGTMSSGAKEGGGGSPAYHLPHPHPHPPQHAQYVGPYRLEKTLGKGQTGEPGEGTPGAGAGELGGGGWDSWVFKGRGWLPRPQGPSQRRHLGSRLLNPQDGGLRTQTLGSWGGRGWGPGLLGGGLGPEGSHPIGAEVGGAPWPWWGREASLQRDGQYWEQSSLLQYSRRLG